MNEHEERRDSVDEIDLDQWVKVWDEKRTFEAHGLTAPEPGHEEALEGRDQRSYIVSMYPYPSGDLHMGHAEVYSISDVIARFDRLRGLNTLNPIGWDSFGLPAENAAIKRDLHPRTWTYDNIAVQAASFKRLGVSFDWRTRLHTSDPEYYRWNQWIFLKLFDQGLAYRKASPVNWCPKDHTVLANEQVVQGACERCGTLVERRNLTQWFFRITDYAQRLLDDMDQLKGTWPEDILAMQRNWIGRSSGAHVDFTIVGRDEPVRVFTTRPDTLYGATFFVVAADAPLARELVTDEHREALETYIAALGGTSEVERMASDRAKTGVFLGSYAVNPVNGEQIPVYASDYVLADYGTGALMAVPAHDQRDLDFAKAMGLPVRKVVETGEEDPAVTGVATAARGTMVGSGAFDGLPSAEALPAIIAHLEKEGLGEGAITYRLRDWLLSRQRFWGTPIPIIHCDDCGEVGVPVDQLPVKLPESGFSLKPDANQSPLGTATEWLKVDCPQCGKPARRDTDTMDTFVDSSWYYLRFPNPDYAEGPFDPEGVKRWLPVDHYIGGKEHANLHLLYARFMTKALHDAGLLHFVEPFRRLTNQGQVIMEGKAMSKSLGNIVNLQEQIAQYGPDAVRVTMIFAGPPEDDIDWATVSPAGAVKWLNRVRRLASAVPVSTLGADVASGDVAVRRGVHRLLDEITQKMEDVRQNVVIARLMELTTLLQQAIDKGPGADDPAVREGVESLVVVLSCFAPFTADDAWVKLGHEPSVATTSWPVVDKALTVDDEVTCVVQINGKVKARLQVPAGITEDDLKALSLESDVVRKALGDATIAKVIVRAPKLVNIALAR
ncbi:leucine--tRNA ligase [Kineosporia succinea]|uniref:Leucine--tRNA ligase n=1 Tax=Kineosporia succinea TaxID=84632 RepID=A0ABT9P892_9ACTN|nr:leucine--tRNA ligase [Kineosporia succinea]MDP9828375.1 leucyl-tRNA synthetase [Kineosporia succinea]